MFGRNLATTKQNKAQPIDGAEAAGVQEVSVTAQIPLSQLVPQPDIEARFMALCQVLISKGVVSEVELAEALRKLDAKPSDS
jgi:hypothetical protein